MGRAEHLEHAPRRVSVAVLTISDTRTEASDASGQYLKAAIQAQGHTLSGYQIVRDDTLAIRGAVTELMGGAQVLISTGGTGIAGRDLTIPVFESLIQKPLPGFGELFRMLSYAEVGGAAMLSRALGGLCGHTLLFALPGSLNAVQTAWEKLLKDELGHLVAEVLRQGQP